MAAEGVGIDGVLEGDLAVVEGGQDAGSLEDGACLDGLVEGDVLPDDELAFLAGEVDDGLDVACAGFHHDGGAEVGVLLLHLVAQGLVGDVLDADVEGGDDVAAVTWRHIDVFGKGVHHLAAVAQARGAAEEAVVGQFDAVARTGGLFVPAAQGAGGEAIGVLAYQHLVEGESARCL